MDWSEVDRSGGSGQLMLQVNQHAEMDILVKFRCASVDCSIWRKPQPVAQSRDQTTEVDGALVEL